MIDRLDPATLREIARELDAVERRARAGLYCGDCPPCLIAQGQAALAQRLADDLRTAAIRHQHSQPAPEPAIVPPAPAAPEPARPTRLTGRSIGAAIAVALLAAALTGMVLVITGAAWVIAWAWEVSAGG